ncbi:MAG: acyl-CoA/acyl-ACP dehydrogenase [Chloroflexi bacterium]|nr:acyl-CoA/acyl-ACP dehydrogenase [Chloroflexota bacterium]
MPEPLHELTDRERELLGEAEELAARYFEPRAAEHDRTGRFPTENYDVLKERRLMGLTVPAEYGGQGISPLAYSLWLRRIAKGCAATALTFNMHANVMRFLALLARPEQQRRYFGWVVERQAVFASFGSEPGVSTSRSRHYDSLATCVPGGAELTGTKHFCSLVGYADYYWVWTVTDDRGTITDRLINCVITSDRPELTILPVWDGLGMRATASDSLRIERCFVSQEDIVPSGGVITSGIIMGFSLGYATVYTALAEASLEYVTRHLRGTVVRGEASPLAQDPVLRRQVAELRVQVEAAKQLTYEAGRAMAKPDPGLRALIVSEAKYFAGEVALEVTSRALGLFGGRGALRSLPLERYFRDARTTTLMPPNNERMLQNIAAAELDSAAVEDAQA